MPNKIELSFDSEYRSIKALEANTLPDLTVICGPNGSSKTHLLEAMENGHIKITDFKGNVLNSRKFDSTPTLTATTVGYGTLQEDQLTAKDARELIEEIEKCFALSLTTNIIFEKRWHSCTRENLLKVFIDHTVQPQFDSGNADIFRKAFTSSRGIDNQVRNRWESFKKFVPPVAIRNLSNFNEVELKSALYVEIMMNETTPFRRKLTHCFGAN